MAVQLPSSPSFVTLFATLRREARALVTPGPRMADEWECALSVALAIGFAHLLGAQNVAWAAFTGFVVIRGRFDESLLRGILRLIGTLLGAAVALAVAPAILASPWRMAIVSGAIGAGTLYGAMTGKRSYAWLLGGITCEMILFDAMETPGLALDVFMRTRLLEVVAGTLACLLVSLASAVTARRLWPAAAGPKPKRLGWHPHAFRHALQAGVAIGLLPPLWHWFRIPQPTQSVVTIMAVMLVPVTSLGASGFVPVSRKIVQRIAGCALGAALAAAILFLARGSVPMLVAGTVLGVVIGRHVENGAAAHAYVGTQFVLAILVVLVPDDYAQVAIGPAVTRLTGILIGMALLEPVLAAWHVLTPRAAAVTPGAAGTPGDP